MGVVSALRPDGIGCVHLGLRRSFGASVTKLGVIIEDEHLS